MVEIQIHILMLAQQALYPLTKPGSFKVQFCRLWSLRRLRQEDLRTIAVLSAYEDAVSKQSRIWWQRLWQEGGQEFKNSLGYRVRPSLEN